MRATTKKRAPSAADPFEGGVKSFQRMLKQWHDMGAEIRKAKDKIKALDAGDEKNQVIGKLLDLLELNDLDRFYQPQITEWKGMLPAALQHRPVAITRDDCRKWVARFLHCMKEGDQEREEGSARPGGGQVRRVEEGEGGRPSPTKTWGWGSCMR